MRNRWVIADTHFGHANILTFTRACPSCAGKGHHNGVGYAGEPPDHDLPCGPCQGTGQVPIRPGVTTIEEHDERIVEACNRLIGPFDKVYHLGDVAMNRRCLITMKRLVGKWELVRGNHDVFKTKDYLGVGFREIHGCVVKEKLMLSHMPIHVDSLARFTANVHGHLHAKVVMAPDGGSADRRYLNVGVEHTNFGPLHWDEVRQRLHG